jgi:hypothetical protein
MPLFGPPDVQKLKAKGDVPGLIKALAYKKDGKVRTGAALALGEAGDDRAIAPLTVALKDPDEHVRSVATSVLAALGVPGPVSARSGTTDDESGSVSQSAVERVNPVVREEPPAEVFVSLAGDDPQARRQAIAALLSSGYQDPEDTRTYAILGRSAGVEYGQDELNKDVEKFPDFDIAYVRAAYPTGRSEDHAHADISLFPEGIVRCKDKARLLARLCSYCTWKGEWLKALDNAVAAVLIGVPSEGPGDMVQVLFFLAAAFNQVGLHNDADLAMKVKAPYSIGPEEKAAVERAVTALASQNADDVRWAADTVREKLL